MGKALPYWQQFRADFPRWCLRTLVSALIICVALYVLSYTTPLSRLAYLGTAALGLLSGLLYLGRLIRRRPRVIVPLLALVLAIAAWVIHADRPTDIAGLRAEYLRHLQAYTGTVYIWGGETHVGVDCSGLARAALVEAMVSEGIKEGNPRLLGPLLWRFWWQDIGTRGMDAGAFGLTRHVAYANALSDGAPAAAQPGDLAVIGRTHVLIYLGDNRWIEANPDDHRVVTNTADISADRPYFNLPAHLMRWTVLETREGPTEAPFTVQRWENLLPAAATPACRGRLGHGDADLRRVMEGVVHQACFHRLHEGLMLLGGHAGGQRDGYLHAANARRMLGLFPLCGHGESLG